MRILMNDKAAFTFGNAFRVQISGSSHGEAVGVCMEGIPAGETVDLAALQQFLNRRAPGRNAASSARKEPDVPIFTQGLQNHITTGEPICAHIANTDVKSRDYDAFAHCPRPSHSDYPAYIKFGPTYDLRGGGAFSGRMTAPLCIAGGIALQLLKQQHISVYGQAYRIGPVVDDAIDTVHPDEKALADLSQKEYPVLSPRAEQEMLRVIAEAKAAGDSVGGMVQVMITGLPVGLGSHMFYGLENHLSQAIFGVPAVKGVTFGDAQWGAGALGSQYNDPFTVRNGRIETETNHCGGILGGMADGMPVYLQAYVKPTPSIALPQKSVDLTTLTEKTITVSGRHDPCIVFRAVPAIEAAAAIALLDLLYLEDPALQKG